MYSLRALRPALARRVVLSRPAATHFAARLSVAGRNKRYSTTVENETSTVETSTAGTSTVETGSQSQLKYDQMRFLKDGMGVNEKLAKEWKVSRSHLPFIWLRDNCRCSNCVNQLTRQRNFDTFSIPADIRPTGPPGSNIDGIFVDWTDGHKSFYPWKFIHFYQTHGKHAVGSKYGLYQPILWGAEIAERQPTVFYDSVMSSDTGVAELTKAIREFGFVLVKDTPYDDPDKTRQLLERIGPIRVTHYGGFYDFIPDMAMADTAYTNLALPAHTDTTYFTEPAGLQAFHLLSHQPAPGASPDEAASGGKSLLVDGFNAANVMRKQHPEDYKVLGTVQLPWHASGNEGITISPDRRYPVLELGPSFDNKRVIHRRPFRIRWNNDDRGVVPTKLERGEVTDWYNAARKWNEILKSKESELWLQLEPGTTLIFDNWRVLHGRSAFTGIRRICGGYINRDDFVSRYLNTHLSREQALEKVTG